MPAKRMKAEVGSTLNVIGSRSAIVSAGPSPGNTPIAVPSVVPTRHQSRFCGVNATAKPFESWNKTSMSAALLEPEQTVERVLEDACADVDAERLGKAEIGDQRKRRTDAGIAQDRLRAEAARDADEQHDRCNRDDGLGDQQAVERETGDEP